MEPSRRCPQACDRAASKRYTDLAPFVAHGQHFRTVAIARRPTRPNFVANWQHFLWDGCRQLGDDATKFCLPWETNPRDGGLLLRCSMVATVFCSDQRERPYLTRFCIPWYTFLRCGVYRIERRPKRREAMRTNGKRTRPPTRPHETVAVSPFSACQFSITLTGLW